jgi:hypothetical protein
VASVGPIGRVARDDGGERRYVASLLWPARAPRAANDNRRRWNAIGVVSLLTSVALLATAAWAAWF